MKAKYIIACGLAIGMMTSCSAPKNIKYFQDVQYSQAYETVTSQEIKIQPGDKITIVVNSRDPKLSELFNLPVMARTVGTTGGRSGQEMAAYTVDPAGNIDFPVLGSVHVAGKTRAQIAQYIKNELVGRDLLKDPVVTVEFANLYVSVVGEVSRPGRYEIDQDKLTVLDAIGMAGDLTIYGKRDNVVVVREVNGTQNAYRIDLTNSQQVFNSPGYYLQQRDVVYVEPNDTKKRQSTANGNVWSQPGIWISLASVLTSVAVLVFK